MTKSYANDVAIEQDENTLVNKYLVFSLDGLEYAIAVEYVIDIINILPLTKVPKCPDYVMGITNLRGKIIPIVDMRLRFGKEKTEYTDRTCVIVIDYEQISVGFVIDEVLEVLVLDDSAISPPPVFSKDSGSRYISGIGKIGGSIKLILDCERILNETELLEEAAKPE